MPRDTCLTIRARKRAADQWRETLRIWQAHKGRRGGKADTLLMAALAAFRERLRHKIGLGWPELLERAKAVDEPTPRVVAIPPPLLPNVSNHGP